MSDDRFAKELMICESPVSEVYGCDFDRVYQVRSKLFKKDFIARAYTKTMFVTLGGDIEFDIVWKSGDKREVRRPFHFINSGILYAMKNHKHNLSDSFALNHELFALEWESCVILHFFDDEPYIFMASREEWLASAIPGQQNEELQVFMQVPDHRRMKAAMIPVAGAIWLKQCIEYKRNR